MRGVYERLAAGDGLDRDALENLADSALSGVVGDIDLFSNVGGNPDVGDYPVRHSVNTAMLALAIGVRTGLDAPAMTVSTKFDEGRKEDRVTFGKSGDRNAVATGVIFDDGFDFAEDVRDVRFVRAIGDSMGESFRCMPLGGILAHLRLSCRCLCPVPFLPCHCGLHGREEG